MNRTVRIGVLGAARIAPMAVIGPARILDGIEVTAVAARDPVKAKRFAKKHKISKVFGGYQELIENREIDAVYNPLPNSLHCDWTIRALTAGKHVLCEKPLASNAEQAERIQAAVERSGCILAEAFHWRYHPLAERMRDIVLSGELGQLRRVEASMCVPFLSFRDIRWQYALAGGALMDVGCYPVSIVRHLAGSEPRVVRARAKLARPNIDRLIEIDLEFPNDIEGFVRGSMFSKHILSLYAKAIGEDGELLVSNPVGPHVFHRITISNKDGRRREKVSGDSTYICQLRAFRDWINEGIPMATDGLHGIANMRVIDEAYLAAGLPVRGDPKFKG